MLGWGKYLNIDDLSLVVCKEKHNHEFYVGKANEIGVKLICHPNNQGDIARSELLEGLPSDPVDVASWRFSYLVERAILKRIKNKKKSHPERKSYQVLDDYYHGLNSGVFFSKNVIRRADKLYSLYKWYPYLSSKVANESNENSFDEDYDRIPDAIFRKTFFKCQFTDLTLSTFVEHRSRLAILKAAVDYTLFKEHGVSERVEEEIKIIGLSFSLKNTLPDTFLKALDSIKDEPYFYRYPVFWQNFLWLFGGFILEDYREEEYKLLSMKTGIPVSEIDNALSAYGKLFPFGAGWFKRGDGNSNIRTLKMMCVPFMGIGANLRRVYYTENGSFEDLSLSGAYTRADLISWNNMVVDVLS